MGGRINIKYNISEKNKIFEKNISTHSTFMVFNKSLYKNDVLNECVNDFIKKKDFRQCSYNTTGLCSPILTALVHDLDFEYSDKYITIDDVLKIVKGCYDLLDRIPIFIHWPYYTKNDTYKDIFIKTFRKETVSAQYKEVDYLDFILINMINNKKDLKKLNSLIALRTFNIFNYLIRRSIYIEDLKLFNTQDITKSFSKYLTFEHNLLYTIENITNLYNIEININNYNFNDYLDINLTDRDVEKIKVLLLNFYKKGKTIDNIRELLNDSKKIDNNLIIIFIILEIKENNDESLINNLTKEDIIVLFHRSFVFSYVNFLNDFLKDEDNSMTNFYKYLSNKNIKQEEIDVYIKNKQEKENSINFEEFLTNTCYVQNTYHIEKCKDMIKYFTNTLLLINILKKRLDLRLLITLMFSNKDLKINFTDNNNKLLEMINLLHDDPKFTLNLTIH